MFTNNIVPIEDFGWMMCLGIVISFLVTYSVFPAMLLILSKAKPSHTLNQEIRLTNWLCELATVQPKRVVFFFLLLAFFSIAGLSLVTFDNRYIENFDEDTDIHRGMKYIDDHFGGTVPFDVYLQCYPFDAPSKNVDASDTLDYEVEDDF